MSGRISPRERRVIGAGAALVALAALGRLVAAPVAQRWSAREDAIHAAADRVARLRALARDGAALEAAATRAEARAALAPMRVLRGRTTALAASALQGALQDAAARSRVSITRLDVVSAPDPGSGEAIPASLSAVTDIYGLAELLVHLQSAPLLLEVLEVAVTSNSALRGDLLQLAVRLRAPYLLSP